MAATQDITGQVFGRLTALKREYTRNGAWYWSWQCECGEVIVQRPAIVKNGHTSSCGCLRVEVARASFLKHDARANGDKLYETWASMRQRCNNPNSHTYMNYGGRGIKICSAWDNFIQFKTDMGPKPGPEYSIERIDNDGDYCPENCKWATRSEQVLNQRPWGTNRMQSVIDND